MLKSPEQTPTITLVRDLLPLLVIFIAFLLVFPFYLDHSRLGSIPQILFADDMPHFYYNIIRTSEGLGESRVLYGVDPMRDLGEREYFMEEPPGLLIVLGFIHRIFGISAWLLILLVWAAYIPVTAFGIYILARRFTEPYYALLSGLSYFVFIQLELIFFAAGMFIFPATYALFPYLLFIFLDAIEKKSLRHIAVSSLLLSAMFWSHLMVGIFVSLLLVGLAAANFRDKTFLKTSGAVLALTALLCLYLFVPILVELPSRLQDASRIESLTPYGEFENFSREPIETLYEYLRYFGPINLPGEARHFLVSLEQNLSADLHILAGEVHFLSQMMSHRIENTLSQKIPCAVMGQVSRQGLVEFLCTEHGLQDCDTGDFFTVRVDGLERLCYNRVWYTCAPNEYRAYCNSTLMPFRCSAGCHELCPVLISYNGLTNKDIISKKLGDNAPGEYGTIASSQSAVVLGGNTLWCNQGSWAFERPAQTGLYIPFRWVSSPWGVILMLFLSVPFLMQYRPTVKPVLQGLALLVILSFFLPGLPFLSFLDNLRVFPFIRILASTLFGIAVAALSLRIPSIRKMAAPLVIAYLIAYLFFLDQEDITLLPKSLEPSTWAVFDHLKGLEGSNYRVILENSDYQSNHQWGGHTSVLASLYTGKALANKPTAFPARSVYGFGGIQSVSDAFIFGMESCTCAPECYLVVQENFRQMNVRYLVSWSSCLTGFLEGWGEMRLVERVGKFSVFNYTGAMDNYSWDDSVFVHFDGKRGDSLWFRVDSKKEGWVTLSLRELDYEARIDGNTVPEQQDGKYTQVYLKKGQYALELYPKDRFGWVLYVNLIVLFALLIWYSGVYTVLPAYL